MAGIWIASWSIGILATHWRDQLNGDHGLTVLHKAVASTLLFLVVARVAWRLRHAASAFPESMSPLMQQGAFIGHFLLYAVALVGLPLSGWYWSSVADKPIMVAGLFQLPFLVAPAPDQYDLAKLVHTWIAWFCGALVGGHLLLALKHHFIDRDAVLTNMLPAKR